MTKEEIYDKYNAKWQQTNIGQKECMMQMLEEWGNVFYDQKLASDGVLADVIVPNGTVCPSCKGSGEVRQSDVDLDECRRCNGTGQTAL
jgi:RecJ-like exonuclease